MLVRSCALELHVLACPVFARPPAAWMALCPVCLHTGYQIQLGRIRGNIELLSSLKFARNSRIELGLFWVRWGRWLVRRS